RLLQDRPLPVRDGRPVLLRAGPRPDRQDHCGRERAGDCGGGARADLFRQCAQADEVVNAGWAKAHAGRACPTCAYYIADPGQARARCAAPTRRTRWARFALPTLRGSTPMQTRSIKVKRRDGEMDAYLAIPDKTPAGAVIAIMEIWGVND